MPLTPLPHAQRAPAPAGSLPAPEIAPERAYAVNAFAWQWYSRPVPHAYAIAYLRHHRRIDLDAAEHNLGQRLVGHSGNGWTGLVDHLRGQGVSEDELLALDLAQHTRHGRLIDTLRDRLVVPTLCPDGQVAGFIGRDTGGRPAAPKYRNPTRTAVYDKAFSVYRPFLDAGSDATVIVVEGALDALAVTAAAARTGRLHDVSACSTLGTSVTPAQAGQVLAFTSGPVVIALDGDTAGAQGTLRWVQSACLDTGRLVHVARLPHGADPADWRSRHDANGLWALDPAARHTESIDVADEKVTPPCLPGRQLAQLACTTTDPVTEAARLVRGLTARLTPEQARAFIAAVTAEMTRQGWNPAGAFTRALDRPPQRAPAAPPHSPARTPLL